MDGYITISGESTAEYSEKRSRFIATVRQVETEEEANNFIAEMRSKYWDARHNCYAYSVEKGALKRFSDDGEPHGTAGKPMLDIIDGSGITNVAVVVTRYFGGVLLGTGGLVRAYSSATKDALALAQRVKMLPCVCFKTQTNYPSLERLTKLIEEFGGTVENTEYTDTVEVSFFLEETVTKGFLSKLTEVFSARLTAEETAKKLCPINIF